MMGEHKSKRLLTAGFAAVVMLAMAGCSLPGWDFDYRGDSPWYAGDDPRFVGEEDEELAVDYEPIVYQITPALIRELRSESWIDGLGITPVPDSEFSSYTVGPGDVLQVVVFGHSDLTSPGGEENSRELSGRLVGPDGYMFFPFVGTFKASGKTVGEIRNVITDGLGRVIRSPQVDVQVVSYRSKKAFVVGTSGNPCAVPLTEFGVTVLEALVSCGSGGGGGSSGGQSNASQVIRLVRGENRYPIDLSELYKESATRIYLKNNDRLVIDRNFNQIFLVGEFGNQGAAGIPPTGLTLAEAITSSGGLNISTADPGNIFVIRGLIKKESLKTGELLTSKQPEVYHLNAEAVDNIVLADQFRMRPRDIVFASAADTVNASRAISQVLPLINTLFQTVFIFDTVGGDNNN